MRGCWTIEGVFFDTDKWDLKPGAYKPLNNIVAVFTANPLLRAEIQGHTDSRGTVSYNRSLSENRAEAVMEYLVKNGIEQNRLRVKGFGDSNPVASNDTPQGRARNRRVELVPTRYQ